MVLKLGENLTIHLSHIIENFIIASGQRCKVPVMKMVLLMGYWVRHKIVVHATVTKTLHHRQRVTLQNCYTKYITCNDSWMHRVNILITTLLFWHGLDTDLLFIHVERS